MYYKITLSRMLFELMDEDPEELFYDFDEEIYDDRPEDASVEPVNTDFEVGAEYKFSIDPKTTDETEKGFLPSVAGNKYYIPFLLGQNDTIAESLDSDSEDYEEAILSSSKCRILISKNIIPTIEIAYFEGKGNQNYSIPVFDYGDVFCIEIPTIILNKRSMYRTDRVVVIK